MVNAEKHKKAAAEKDADVKPIKSTISVNFNDDSDVNYTALSCLHNCQIKEYVADNFKKEISDLDILNIAMLLLRDVVTAETDDEKANVISDVNDIVTDKYKLNEYIFTRLATIKSWNETTASLISKYGEKSNEVSEKEFNELMNAKNEKNQYKAWNDERKVLDMYELKGDVNGGNN